MRIAVALSGGVDSSVAAALLAQDGHEVVGVTLQQWPNDDPQEVARHGGCCSLTAVEDARRVASLVGIPFYVWNLEREFGERVVRPFHESYRRGRTPNPCVDCNRMVRFDLMLGRVLALGFDALATGHYARVLPGPEGPELHAALDPGKDQSYMLYGLDRQKLAAIRFPLGELSKPQVRAIAHELGLPVAAKPESQDICFVPRRGMPQYLAARLPLAGGPVVDTGGRHLGTHGGTPLYTVGQRSGLGGLREPGPWYVLRVEAESNRLVVGRTSELGATEVMLEAVTFISGSVPSRVECEARLRYRAEAIPAVYERGRLWLSRPFRHPAPGQAAVLYSGSRVLGGGTIREAL